MVAKAEIAKETLSAEQVATLCKAFVGIKLPLQEHGVLFGGYSGTSIRVTGADGKKALLKVCHGYSVKDAAQQAAVASHVASHGFRGICSPMPLVDKQSTTPYVLSRPGDGTPVMMLSWVDGVAADKVVSGGQVPSGDVLASVGASLAALHSVAVSGEAASKLRACEVTGACDVAKHLSGELERKMSGSAHTRAHPFVTEFYAAEKASLVASMGAAELPRGVLHGDPFLDNMLADPSSGTLQGFVDLEDFCVGPLLFDVACCASACCFRADGALDMRRVRALLEGYASVRPLTPTERTHFVAFMRLTMLCNCTWRFINFNIENRELADMANAHVELQDRIIALHDDITVGAINGVLKKLPTAPTATSPLYAPPPLYQRASAKQLIVVGALAVACVAVSVALTRSKGR